MFKLRIELLTLFFLASSILASAEFEKIWVWNEEDREATQVSFSPDGTKIALVSTFSFPDGHAAESYPREYLDSLHERSEKEPRFGDPEIYVIENGEKIRRHSDWGWSPTFSPRGSEIAYTRQKLPISGKRRLADCLRGNPICLWDLREDKTHVLDEPEKTYFEDPVFSDGGKRLYYEECDNINGDFGGPVGISWFDIAKKEKGRLWEPTRNPTLYTLVSWLGTWKSIPIFMCSKPLTDGLYVADSYESKIIICEKRKQREIVLDSNSKYWNAQIVGDRVEIPGEDGEGAGMAVGLDSKNGRFGLRIEGIRGPISSKGVFVTYNGDKYDESEKSEIVLKDLTGIEIQKIKLGGLFREVSWSPDGNRLAVVYSKYGMKKDRPETSDEVAVFGKSN